MISSTLQFQGWPSTVPQLLAMVAQHLEARRFLEAEALARQVLTLQPGSPAALRSLGLIALEARQPSQAAEYFRAALAGAPEDTALRKMQATALLRAEEWDQAIACLRRLLEAQPEDAGTYRDLAEAWGMKREYGPAIDCYEKALTLRPSDVRARNNLANALAARGEWNRAIDNYQAALALEPANPVILTNLGCAWAAREHWPEAIECHQRALAIYPGYADAHCNLGSVWRGMARWEEAMACYRRALALRPELSLARYNLSQVLLLLGNFAEGWAAYESRPERPRGTIDSGESLAGRSVLLRAEQGLGDTLQFVRYLPLLHARGARVKLQCKPALQRLFQLSWPEGEFLAMDAEPVAADLSHPLLSLPLLLGAPPTQVPYLRADPAEIARWRERLANDARPKVGLVWAGSREHPDDRARSLKPEDFRGLLALAEISFYSLQKGDAATEAEGTSLIDHTADLHDFAATAALVECLDLVITVDTAVAHLAGALGKAVWVLIPSRPDWRWRLAGDRSAWYPTMRLWRRAEQETWSAVLEHVRAALAAHTMSTSGG